MEAILKFEKVIGEQSGTSKAGKEWQKAEVLVSQQDGEYTNTFVAEAWGGDVALAKKLIVGQEFRTNLTITSREYQGKYYTNAKLFGVKVLGETPQVKKDWKDDKTFTEEDPSDGLPF